MNHRCVRLLVCLWVGALSSSVGCAHDPNPSELATRYKEALSTDDPELAWALMSPEARAVTNREEFERRWETSRDARRVLATITTPDDTSPPNLWLEGVTMHSSDRRVRWTEVDGVFIATGGFTELDERRSPLAALAATVKERAPDAMVMVDVVTSLAGAELRFDAWGLDFAFAGTQKCLALPPGLGVYAASDRALTQAASVEERGFLFDLVNDACEEINLCPGQKACVPGTLTPEALMHYDFLRATLTSMGVD